jgi:serine protease
VSPTTSVDSDSNDVSQKNQGSYRNNDTVSTAQPVQTPLLLAGTVNWAQTGPAGNNYAAGDVDDYFSVDLVAGQVVELEFASDPNDADVDLYIYSPSGNVIGLSDGTDSRFECVRITTPGRYVVNVYANKSASIYNLRIGAPGSGSSCANTASPAAMVPGQLLAKAKPLGAAKRSKQEGLLRAANITGAQWLGTAQGQASTSSAPVAVPHLLSVPADAEGRSVALAWLGGNSGAEARARRLSAAPSQTAGAPGSAAAASAEAEAIDLLKLSKALRASGAFQYVQPNWLHETQATVGEFPPNDRFYNLQRWHYEQINLPAAMSRITQLPAQPSQRPVVAVIDDGVMLDHPDMQPQLFSPGRAFISRVTVGDGNTASGDNTAVAANQPVFHGTHVAGTVGAATYDGIGGAGTAPMALILPLRVFPPDRPGAQSVDIINAMLYAARLPNNSGTLPSRRADVMNLSLGSSRPCDAAFQDAINQVRAAGVIVVAAAGNSGRNDVGWRVDVGSPANCSGAIAVSALDAGKRVTFYSQTGSTLKLAAPGGDTRQSTTGSGSPDGVYSAVGTFDAGGRRQPAFSQLMGTSMASPHVAGVMALMRYVNPALTVAQVDDLLAQGALSDDLGSPGRDIDFGYGLVNAGKAVDAALAASTTPPPAAPSGRVVASPSSIDFGSLRTTATLDLALNADGAESVASISSDNPAVTVVASNVDPVTRLGRYTVNVNRASLSAGTTVFPRLTITLAPARTVVVQLSITQPVVGGSTAGGNLGPLYVLLINPQTGITERSVLAVRGSTGYTWSVTGWSLPTVQITAGSDLDNDAIICQRGEACGAYPVLAPGRDLTVVTLTGNRSDLNLEVAPLAGASPQNAGAATPGRQRTAGATTATPTTMTITIPMSNTGKRSQP